MYYRHTRTLFRSLSYDSIDIRELISPDLGVSKYSKILCERSINFMTFFLRSSFSAPTACLLAFKADLVAVSLVPANSGTMSSILEPYSLISALISSHSPLLLFSTTALLALWNMALSVIPAKFITSSFGKRSDTLPRTLIRGGFYLYIKRVACVGT